MKISMWSFVSSSGVRFWDKNDCVNLCADLSKDYRKQVEAELIEYRCCHRIRGKRAKSGYDDRDHKSNFFWP